MRSQHQSGRQKLAEKVYQQLIKAFDTDNFTDWVFDESKYTDMFDGIFTLFDSINKDLDFQERSTKPVDISYYYDVVPPYCSGFAPFLGYTFCNMKPTEVGSLLDEKFPNPDILDCDYLDDILAEIQNTIAEGYGYDPGIKGGIDYDFPAESIASLNVVSALRWLVRNRTMLLRTVSQPVASVYSATPQTNSANANPVPLSWLGQVADLAEILHRLEKGGIIDLKKYFGSGGKGIDLCRGLANVFAFREEKAIDNLNGYLSHLKKSVGPGEIDEEVMRKIGRKRGGKMDNMMPS